LPARSQIRTSCDIYTYATDANIAAVVNKPPNYLHSSRVKIKFLGGINDGGGSKLQRLAAASI
jgi:hypothetical protein